MKKYLRALSCALLIVISVAPMWAASSSIEKARLGFDGVLHFTPYSSDKPGILYPGSEIQPVLTVRHSNYGELTMAVRLVPLEKVTLYELFRWGATTIKHRHELSVQDGGSSNLPLLSQSGKTSSFSDYRLTPGLWRYQLEIWFGSSREIKVFGDPDRVLHSWIRVVDRWGKSPPDPEQGSLTIARIQDIELTEDNLLRYIFVGPFAQEDAKKAIGLGINLFDPVSMKTYEIEGKIADDPRPGYAEQIIGVVEMSADLALSQTIVIGWEFVRGRASAFYTVPNEVPK